MRFSFDTFAYGNALSSFSPGWKMGFAFVSFLLANLSHWHVQCILLIWMMFWTTYYARIPVKPYFMLLGTSILFFLASMPAFLIEIRFLQPASENILFSYSIGEWFIYVPKSGLEFAWTVFIRSLTSVSCLLFIIFTVPFAHVLQVMKKIRLPAIVIELTLIMYRFIFIFADTAYGLFIAQKVRGGHQHFSAKIRDISFIIVQLFLKTFHRYKQLSYGLAARGFSGDIPLAPMQARKVPVRFRVESWLGCLLLICLEIWFRWERIQ